MTTALACTDLAKRYGRRYVIDGVTFAVEASTFLSLLGPSGSGKSTLLRLICGFERPQRGEIALFGRTVATPTYHLPPERRNLALVFQDGALWPHLTALENVRFALRRRGLPRREEAVLARAVLERVGLGFAADRYPHQLSGGEQQRVGLARALVARPPLILFDEPLSALDAELREQLRVEIATLVRESGATAIYVTHDQQEAFALGDRVGVLKDGRLIQLADPQHLYARPASRFVAAFTGVAGELRGRVLGCSERPDRRFDLRLDLGGGRRLVGVGEEPLSPGAAAVCCVRPSAVWLVGEQAANLRAVVRECAFSGAGWRYALELEGGGLLAGVAGSEPLRLGEVVGVAFDPHHCHVFADDAREAPPATGGSVDAADNSSRPAKEGVVR
jgi:iron(III) transport system ATP-binding protein